MGAINSKGVVVVCLVSWLLVPVSGLWRLCFYK